MKILPLLNIPIPNSLGREFRFKLELGDLIMLSTDGLTDNLFIEEIVGVIKRGDMSGTYGSRADASPSNSGAIAEMKAV